MELFKDKGVLELTKELTKELRTRSIEDKEIPRFIFVCGEQILDDKGNLIDTNILESQNNIRYLIMNNFLKHKNCGEYGKESHPTKGPIKKIENQHEENVILYNGKGTLRNSLELNDMIRRISSREVKYTPNLNAQELNLKNLIYELLNLTELFEPVTAYELEILYKEIREISNYTICNKDKHKIVSFKRLIRLMEEMKIIRCHNGYLYINKDITCYNTMFTISRKYLNAFRMKYLCRVYKCEPERIGEFL